MAVDESTVKKVAKLARIKLETDECHKITAELTKLLNFVERLDAVDTTAVEPMVAISHEGLYLREDKVTDGQYSDKILANAPLAQENFFLVPKVIE